MGYEGTSIRELLGRVRSGEIILPALQRSYVWKEEQICSLFDSLMKDYPIGAFLFWELGADDIQDFKFNKFISDVDKIDMRERGDYAAPEGFSPVAVLDGQQRITSLYVGLYGSWRSKIKAARKIDNDYPKRYLALNILHVVEDTKDDIYEFEFLSEKELQSNDSEHFWFRVSDILEKGFEFQNVHEYVFEQDSIKNNANAVKAALTNITQLLNCVTAPGKLSFYTARNKSLAEAVEIFERINNRGQALNGTDLMLSLASAANKTDMQKRINDAIKEIENATNSDIGFVPDRAFILTAALMATGAENLSTTYRENYSSERIEAINTNWEEIIDAISNAAVYVEKLGFNGKKLGKSFMHPIAYYFFKLGPNVNAANRFSSMSEECRNDRRNIVQWLLRAQIKGIFDYGSTKQLQNIQKIMNIGMTPPNNNTFPLGALMTMGEGHMLEITSDDLKAVAEWKYGDAKILPLMTAVLEGDAQVSYDVDHMWPQSKMSTRAKIRKAAKEADVTLTEQQISFYLGHYNLLPNLQLLKRTPNSEKNNDFFKTWIEAAYPDEHKREKYMEDCCISNIDFGFGNFESFYKARRDLLVSKMEIIFGVKKDSE